MKIVAWNVQTLYTVGAVNELVMKWINIKQIHVLFEKLDGQERDVIKNIYDFIQRA
jgi:hypothetical protein